MADLIHEMRGESLVVTPPEKVLRWIAGELGYPVTVTSAALVTHEVTAKSPLANELVKATGVTLPVTRLTMKPTKVIGVDEIEIGLNLVIQMRGIRSARSAGCSLARRMSDWRRVMVSCPPVLG